jgi:hypothetical protein
MSSPEAYDDIQTRLSGNWTATPLVFENDPYTLPDTPAPFLYVEIFGDDFDQIQVGQQGQNMWEERGVAYFHVMVPNDTGSAAARAYAKQALNLFREQQIGSIRTVKMSIGQGQPGRSFANYWAMTTTMWWARYDTTNLT